MTNVNDKSEIKVSESTLSPSPHIQGEKALSKTSKSHPTKNLLGFKSPKRKITSMWLDQSVHNTFMDACRLTGRKTCDVIEPFERAYARAVKKVVFKEEIEPCLFKPVIINMTLNLTEKYASRERKFEGNGDKFIFCSIALKEIPAEGDYRFTCHTCMYGGNHKNHQDKEPCEKYHKIY